jgi:hypothetical protein
MVLERLDIHIKKLKIDPHLSSNAKKIKWIKDLNVKHVTLKLLEETISKTPENTGIGNTFLNRTPIAQEIQARIDKLLHSKWNNYQNQVTTYRMGEHLCQLLIG